MMRRAGIRDDGSYTIRYQWWLWREGEPVWPIYCLLMLVVLAAALVTSLVAHNWSDAVRSVVTGAWVALYMTARLDGASLEQQLAAARWQVQAEKGLLAAYRRGFKPGGPTGGAS